MNKTTLGDKVAEINVNWEGKLAMVADRYLVRFGEDEGMLVAHEEDGIVFIHGATMDTENVMENMALTRLVGVTNEGAVPSVNPVDNEQLDFWKNHVSLALAEVMEITEAQFAILAEEDKEKREAIKRDHSLAQISKLNEIINAFEEAQEDGEEK